MPPILIRKTVTLDHIIGLEDGKPNISLNRHLTTRGSTLMLTVKIEACCMIIQWSSPPGDPDSLRPGAAGPMGDLTGRLGSGRREHIRDGIGGMGWLAGRAVLVAHEAFDAFFGVALPPPPHRGLADAILLGDVQDAEAFGQEQDDVGVLDVLEVPSRSATMADRRARSAAEGTA